MVVGAVVGAAAGEAEGLLDGADRAVEVTHGVPARGRHEEGVGWEGWVRGGGGTMGMGRDLAKPTLKWLSAWRGWCFTMAS